MHSSRFLPFVRYLVTLALRSIRNRLTALKRDRADFIKPSEVNALYQAVVKQGPYNHDPP